MNKLRKNRITAYTAAAGSPVMVKPILTGLEAFEKWITRLEKARGSLEEIDPDMV